VALDGIDTIVFVMLENRSFDHALGYLSTGAAAPPLPVDGVRDDPAWLDAQANLHDGVPFRPHPIGPEVQDIADPPHDHAAMALQIGTPRGTGADRLPQMGGFVSSYMRRERPPRDPSLVMAYYTPDAVPVFDFFARHYAVCDRWFAGLPTGTQANRLMAMAGESPILDNAGVLLPERRLVYDWLTAHDVPWCT
jgi:phospholipase C